MQTGSSIPIWKHGFKNFGPWALVQQSIQAAKNSGNQPNPSGTQPNPSGTQPNPSGTPQAGSGGAGMGVYNDIVKYMDNNGLSYFSGSVPDTEKQKMLDESWKMQDTAGRQWVNDVNTNLINRVNNEMDKLDKKALGQVEGTAEQKWKQDGLGEADTLIGETGTLSLGAPKYSPLGYIPPKREIADNKNIQLTREQEKQPRSHSGSSSGNQQPQYFGYSTLGIDPGKHQIVGVATGNSTHNGLANLWERAFNKKESFDKLAGESKTALQPNLKRGLDPLFTQQYDFTSRNFDPKTNQWSEKNEKLTLPQVLEKTMVAISDSMGLTSRVDDKVVTDAILKQNAKFPIVVDANGNTYINKYYLQSSQGNRDQLQLIATGAISNLMGQQTTTGLQHMTDAMKKNNEAITRQIVKSNLNPRTGLVAGEYHYIFTDVLMTSLAEALTQGRNGRLTIKSTTK
ncbi:MAG: hypothetical protein WHV28_08845 [Bacteroidota bacterium]